MLVGVFDGLIGNLFWHLLVILLYPVLLYILTVGLTGHYIRKYTNEDSVRAGRFNSHYDYDENFLQKLMRVFGNGVLMLFVGPIGVLAGLPAIFLLIARFILELLKALPRLICFLFV